MGAKLARCDSSSMTSTLRRLRTAVSELVAEDRPGFRERSTSSSGYDDGSWLKRS
jgi:hypothetical protein